MGYIKNMLLLKVKDFTFTLVNIIYSVITPDSCKTIRVHKRTGLK